MRKRRFCFARQKTKLKPFKKLNEKKKVLLKNMLWKGGKKILLEGGLIFNGEIGDISKKLGLDKKEVVKK